MITMTDERKRTLLILSTSGTGAIDTHLATSAQLVTDSEAYAHVYLAAPEDTVTVTTASNESATLFLYDSADVMWSGNITGENRITIPIPANMSTFKVALRIS